ncbi:MAG: sigma-70 family RNA polymerase sigma factor [Chloroflexales bacterium]|nr:sigma-70 family RNA polymerase sigma factor [Chloroflexales bacterium]
MVRRLRDAYQWSLLDDEALETLVLAMAPPDATPTLFEQLTRDQYSRALWEACRQLADPPRRERAYAELQRYLYRAAYNRRPDQAEECVQRAIELVIAQIERCREPGAFFTFALNKLRQALSEESDRASRASSTHEPLPEPATAPDAVAAAVERRERAATVLAAVGGLPDLRQRQAVLLKFIEGLTDEVIGARLEITPNLVRVLRHRALTRLRSDPRLAALHLGDP